MFDEASSNGMLLNNLLIAPNHMISLDSSMDVTNKFVKEDVIKLSQNVK